MNGHSSLSIGRAFLIVFFSSSERGGIAFSSSNVILFILLIVFFLRCFHWRYYSHNTYSSSHSNCIFFILPCMSKYILFLGMWLNDHNFFCHEVAFYEKSPGRILSPGPLGSVGNSVRNVSCQVFDRVDCRCEAYSVCKLLNACLIELDSFVQHIASA